ncbi:MAG: hypothetical protein QOF48_1661 [Verrucomicrobiota bacterium]
MNARFLAGISIAANVALVAVGLWRGGHFTITPAHGGLEGARSATTVVQVKTNLTRIELTETNDAAAFHWRQIQSEDWNKFATNLIGIGCPPETARAILESEAWELFLPRRRVFLEPFHRRYWDLAASAPSFEKAFDPASESVQKLRDETFKRLEGLVGGKGTSDVEESEKQSPNQHLDFLSSAKQQAIEDLEKKFAEESGRLRSVKGAAPADFKARGAELTRQRKAAIAALMTPEENVEYELRGSRFAKTAESSVGFEATPEEAREVTRIYQQFEGASARVDRKLPDAAAKRAEAQAALRQREQALRQSLGESRYAQFQQGTDGDFSEIYKITERYELPREVAAQAADALKARGAALKQLATDKGLTPDERAQRVLAVQMETRGALQGVVGERALRTYEKYQGPLIPVDEAPR